MDTRQKIMGLAALPLAGLLATGGAALAQSTGSPAGTQVVQQAAVTQQDGVSSAVQLQLRDRDRDGSCDQQTATVQTTEQTRERTRDGSCDQQAATLQTADRTMDRVRDGSCDR